ncbi:hypothetical protein GC177_02045 [bacterium]|nr:hypothetical protein [bacterium]
MMNTHPHTPSDIRGFSLIETAMVLLVMGLVASALLSLGTKAGETAKLEMTNSRMDAIEKAMGAFFHEQGRLPCPAQGWGRLGSAQYGVEATGANCTALRITVGTVNFYVGNVPIITLGLSDEALLDGWNRRVTYVVDERFITSASQLTASPVAPGIQPANDGRLVVNGDGGVTLTNGTSATGGAVPRGAAFVLISHGTNGVGAWPLQNASGNSDRIYLPAGERVAFLAARPEEVANAGLNPHPAANAPLSFGLTYNQLSRGTNFDDVVRYYMREDVIRLAGGIVDYDVCLMASRATKDYISLVNPPLGPIGCVDEDAGQSAIDPLCADTQTQMALAIARLCMLQP